MTKEDSSDRNQSTAFAASIGWPTRPIGTRVLICSARAGLFLRLRMSVSIGPGRTVLTRTPSLASLARRADGQQIERALGRGVVHRAATGAEHRIHRRDVDDRAALAAMLLDMRRIASRMVMKGPIALMAKMRVRSATLVWSMR